jgi:hypothetical protein
LGKNRTDSFNFVSKFRYDVLNQATYCKFALSFVEIIDMNGKLLEQIPISKIVDLISIDTKSLKPGNYILKLHNTSAKFTKQ